MVHTSRLLGLLLVLTTIFTACTENSGLLLSDDLEPAIKTIPADEDAILNNIATPQPAVGGIVAALANRSLAIWADCEGFGTIGTPATFKPTAGKFDELYTGVAFQDGLGAISESKPGDRDYNGGRWHVNTLKAGVDPQKYTNACSVNDLDLNDFESTETYFECPLLPARGRGPK